MSVFTSYLCRQLRRGFQKALGVGLDGEMADLLAGPGFDDLPGPHDHDIGGEIADQGHGVGDEEVSQMKCLLEMAQQVHDLGPDADVERGDRLIQQEQLGAKGEGSGDIDSLALAAGKFVRIAGQG